jgi:hypothetical protein
MSVITIPWSPADIDTIFWYDPSDINSIVTGSDSSIVSVADKSGNGRILLPRVGQTSPYSGTRLLNDLNVIEWTGDNCLEVFSFVYDQANVPLNLAFVVYHDAAINQQEFYFSGTESADSSRIFGRRTDKGQYDLLGPNRIITPINSILDNQPSLVVNQINGANSLVRINGEQKVSGDIGSNAFQLLRFGHNENEVSDLDGYFAEIIGFADSSQQEIVEGYLAWKWGLVDLLPITHAYKTINPLALPSTPEPTLVPTLEPTIEPTLAPTLEPQKRFNGRTLTEHQRMYLLGYF